jgi:glucosamine-6-phosphate deaminase
MSCQTSGNIAVTDDEALKFAEVASDFVTEVTAEINFASVIEFLNNKTENQVDSIQVRKLKGLIRRRESFRQRDTLDCKIKYSFLRHAF